MNTKDKWKDVLNFDSELHPLIIKNCIYQTYLKEK